MPGGLLLFTVGLWMVAIVISSSSNDETTSSLAGLVLIFSFIVLIATLVGWVIIKPLIGPRGKVMERQAGAFDYLVEIRNVHPAFAFAVMQARQARAGQQAALSPPPLPPVTT
jgi:hypothetical protein